MESLTRTRCENILHFDVYKVFLFGSYANGI